MSTQIRHWQIGFFLALLTALMWGVLPIALKVLLEHMDALTITWYRFLAAAFLLGAYLLRRRMLPLLARLKGTGWALLSIAILGLSGNYVLYLLGLENVSPATAQMVIQLAPMFLLLGGVIIFRETFRPIQIAGLVILIGGLLLFFNNRLADLAFSDHQLRVGVILVAVSALVWAAYGLAQKRLLGFLASEEILFLVFLAAVLLLFPSAHPAQVEQLGSTEWLLLIFCCINTVIAYGSFAESLVYWEASRVSAVLCTAPLITLAFMKMAAEWLPESAQMEKLNKLALIGAFLVIAGSMLAALGSRKRPVA